MCICQLRRWNKTWYRSISFGQVLYSHAEGKGRRRGGKKTNAEEEGDDGGWGVGAKESKRERGRESRYARTVPREMGGSFALLYHYAPPPSLEEPQIPSPIRLLSGTLPPHLVALPSPPNPNAGLRHRGEYNVVTLSSSHPGALAMPCRHHARFFGEGGRMDDGWRGERMGSKQASSLRAW